MYLPMLDLRTPQGELAPWGTWWQRQNLLLLLAHRHCEGCQSVMKELSERSEALARDKTVGVVLVGDPDVEVPPGPQVLVDPEGRLPARLGLGAGCLVAVDRFFDILRVVRIDRAAADLAVDDALGWVALSEKSCPECGVSTWPEL